MSTAFRPNRPGSAATHARRSNGPNPSGTARLMAGPAAVGRFVAVVFGPSRAPGEGWPGELRPRVWTPPFCAAPWSDDVATARPAPGPLPPGRDTTTMAVAIKSTPVPATTTPMALVRLEGGGARAGKAWRGS